MRLTFVLIGQILGADPDESSPGRPHKRMRVEEETTSTSEPATTTTTIPTSAPASVASPAIYFPEGVEFPFQVAIGVNIIGVTARGRLVEEYNVADLVRTYGEDAVRIVTDQVRLDQRHDLFTPRTFPNVMTQLTPLGEVQIGPLLAQSGQSTVFHLLQYPNILIKFQTNCLELDSDDEDEDKVVVHSLIFDHAYGRDAARHGIAMEPIFVSPPAALCHENTGICDFDELDEDGFDECRERGGSLRYMLVRKSNGESLGNFARRLGGGSLPFTEAMSYGAAMMRVLQTLHLQAKVVHGDLHEENWFVEIDSTTGLVELKLIDFGSSARVHTYPEHPRVVNPHYPAVMRNYTWAMDVTDFAPRDDVMKAIITLAALIATPPGIFDMIKLFHSLCGPEAEFNFTMQSDIFRPLVPWSRPLMRIDPVSLLAVSDDHKLEIRQNLANILTMVRGLNSANSVIPYQALINSFERCYYLSQNQTIRI